MAKNQETPECGKESRNRKRRNIRQIGSITLASALLATCAGNVSTAAVKMYRDYDGEKKTIIWPATAMAEKVPESDSIVGVTWNVHKGKTVSGKRNIIGVEAELKNRAADFICLQEVRRDDAERIAIALPSYTSVYDPSYVSPWPGRQTEGNMMLISTRVAPTHQLEVNSKQLYQKGSDLLPRSLTTVEIDNGSENEVVIFNTHLEAKDVGANLRQAAEVNSYVRNRSDGREVIGCADINADIQNSKTSSALTGSSFVAWQPPENTFKNETIDGFFSTKQSYSAASMTVGTDRLSDHKIVTARFETQLAFNNLPN